MAITIFGKYLLQRTRENTIFCPICINSKGGNMEIIEGRTLANLILS